MATFLSSALLLGAALQSPQAPLPDSVRAALWARVTADSTDGPAWLGLGRAYLRRSRAYHAHHGAVDSGGVRAALDTAELAFAWAARVAGSTAGGDSARVLQFFVYGERAYLEWETAGPDAAAAVWRRIPAALRLPPVLEELGENLLRACPRGGLLFTAGDIDTHTAWYLRFGRGLRPDLLIVPHARWRGDSVFRRRVLRAELDGVAQPVTLRAIGEQRALCASMGFERPPQSAIRSGEVRWNKRPLVWVAGREARGDRVPAQDFVFAALRLAVEQQETWTAPALTLYRRAVKNESDLCRPLRTFGLRGEVGC